MKSLIICTVLAGFTCATIPALGALWTPASTNTALWLDAADPDTILTSGNSVTNWLDKSGQGRHVLQANASYQPTNSPAAINSLNAIGFANDALQTSTNDLATWLNNTNYHFIAVLKHNSRGSYIGTDSGGGGGAVLAIGYFHTTTDNWRHGHFGNDGNFSVALDITPMVAVSSFNNPGAELFIDGSSLGSSGPTVPLNTAGPLSVGKPVGIYAAGDLGYLNGLIGEIICITGDLALKTRHQLEGYLAHKWGTADKLPVDHPHKDDPPTIPDKGTVITLY